MGLSRELTYTYKIICAQLQRIVYWISKLSRFSCFDVDLTDTVKASKRQTVGKRPFR